MHPMSNGEAITPEGLEALKAELERLEGDARRDIAQRIKVARELGDLSENAEYHIAKEDQAHLETKIARLNERLRKARVVEEPVDSDVVGFGSTVTLRDDGAARELTYTLVSAVDADAGAGRLSFESPMARALEGAKIGDTVRLRTPKGERALTVLAVG
jgi:transcription elongation factor GreA